MAVGPASLACARGKPLPVHPGRRGVRGRMRISGDRVIGPSGEVVKRSMPLCALLLLVALVFSACNRQMASGGELHITIRSDPKTLNPLLAEDDSSDIVRYLTGGVLIRVNRKTQENEAELASSWKVDQDGRRITFNLRPDLKFSDGTDFTAEDVVATVNAALDPSLHSPKGDPLRAGGKITAKAIDRTRVSLEFEHAIAGLERLFDDIAISPARVAGKAG